LLSTPVCGVLTQGFGGEPPLYGPPISQPKLPTLEPVS